MSEIKEEEELNHTVHHNFKAVTTISALEILSKLNFKSNEFAKKKIFHIKIKITGKIDENLNEACFAHCFDVSSSVLIAFKSKKEVRIFWKTSTCEKFHLIRICDFSNEISSYFCEQFLINEIVENKNGFLLESKGRRNINLQDLGNDKGQNLLILAAIDNRDDVVAELLKYDFDVDYEDNDGHIAIEKSWMNCMNASNLEIKEKCYKIILSLLKNNSKYPRKIEIKSENESESTEIVFDCKNCSELIKSFVNYSEKLHNLVTESNLEELKLELEKEPKLCCFYDRNNKSLMAHAIESKELYVWKLLISLKLCSGHHEIQNLGNFYKNYEISKKILMQAEHQKWAKEFPSSHIHFLLTCSRIGNNDRRCDERWNLVKEAYRIMDSDESCSKILKISAKWKDITIYFDFKHDTAYYLDPVSSLGTKGVIYGAHTIYIGAKNLADDKMKHEVISTIIHELCHLAVFLTYINNYKPYPNGESEERKRFEDEVVPECEENGHLEEIVVRVSKYYDKKDHHSEYIVRIVQMLMHYYIKNPSTECENSKILKDRREKFGKLFEYFKDVVEKDFDDFLKIIDTLLDEYEEIKYEQLTGPMKAKILHSEVKFQGQDTTLHEIIGNNEEILNKMTTIQIFDILIRGECIDIGSKHITSTKISIVARTFAILDVYIWKNKTMSEIQSEVEYSKIFILSDSAGAGKTTTFEQLTENLKEKYKNFWVCFIKLRAHRSIFDSCNRSQELNLEDVLKLLIEIQNIKEGLEAEIFKFLFKNDKVILLLDGVDEISPDYNDLMVKVLKILREETKNQLWISSRPQCGENLEENLNVHRHILIPYTIDERNIFINEIYDNFSFNLKDLQTTEQKIHDLNILNIFFESLEKNEHNVYVSEVNNPLMIKMITELYIQEQIDLNPESANLFVIFDKVTAKLRKEVGQKVESKDNNAFSTFTLGHVHQVLFLKQIFEYKDIKNVSIMKRWKEQRTNWSVDTIQRFGFVTLDSRFDKDPRKYYIDFIHRTYADFFATQFIISVIFDPNCVDFKNSNDFKIILQLISFSNMSSDGFTGKFLSSFMKSKRSQKIKGIKNIDYIRELFDICVKHKSLKIDEIEFEEQKYKNYNFVKFFLIILSNNPNIIESVWKLTESKNLLHLILLNTKFEFRDICEILQISFGNDWDVKFIKNKKKVDYKEINENVKINVKSFLNLVEFVEDNFDILERQVVYHNHSMYTCLMNISEITVRNVSMKIFMRFVEISSDEENEAFLKIVKKFVWNDENIENLLFWKDQCEKMSQNCNEKYKNFLSKFKRFIMEQLFEKKSINSFDQTKFQRLQQTKQIWINDKKLKRKLRKSLNFRKTPLSHFNKFSDKDLNDMKSVLLELFKHNKIDIFKTFSYPYLNDLDDLILNEDKFKRFDTFLSDFNDSNLKLIMIRNILNSGNLLTKSVKSGKDNFKRILDLHLIDKEICWKIKYDCTYEYAFENLISNLLSNMTEEIYPEFKKFIFKIFENEENLLRQHLIKTRIYKPLEQKETFAIFEKFLFELFDQSEFHTASIMKLNLMKYIFELETFLKDTNIERTFEIITIYGEYYKGSYEQLQGHLKSKNIFLRIISEISEIDCENFTQIFNKIFTNCKPNPNKCLKCNNESASIFFKNKEKMKNLEYFLNNIFIENEVKNIVKINLIYDNFTSVLHDAVQNAETLGILNQFIIDNNCSYEKLQNICISKKSLLKIFVNTNKENYEKLSELMRNIFASNVELILESLVSFEDDFNTLRHKENFQDFEEFLLKIFDQHLADKCVNKIIRCIYDPESHQNKICDCFYQSDFINEVFEIFICEKHELILWIFYYANLNEINILTDLTKNNKDHWEWVQELFLDKFPFESIQRMSIETYDAFENFLKLVFKSNKNKLSEKIQNKYLNDEIMNNENENCKKFVQAFININENN